MKTVIAILFVLALWCVARTVDAGPIFGNRGGILNSNSACANGQCGNAGLYVAMVQPQPIQVAQPQAASCAGVSAAGCAGARATVKTRIAERPHILPIRKAAGCR